MSQSHLRLKAKGDGSRAGSPTIRAATLVHNVQVGAGNFHVVGRDNHTHIHYHAVDFNFNLKSLLRAIPNFRKIYQDTLVKATPGTGIWLLEGRTFRLWLDLNGDLMILWGSGIPGGGKTVLASIVIRYLEAWAKEANQPICVAYVYIRYSDHSEATVRGILEILVKQTLERHPECRQLVEQAYERHLQEDTQPTEGELLQLLAQLSEGMAATFYIIDALDEAPVGIRLALVKQLSSLKVRLFITSRPLKALEAKFPRAFTFPILATEHDLDLLITEKIDGSVELQDLLKESDPSLRKRIIDTVKSKCGGMFLHASLQLTALQRCITAREALQTLEEFPSQLEDIYIATWQRIIDCDPDHASLAKEAFAWIVNARRSMTVDELRHALAACPTTFTFQRERLMSETALIALCRGLVVVEEESKIVRLVHYTAKRTLEGLLPVSHPYPHSRLSAVCIGHLTVNGFQDTTFNSEEDFHSALQADPLLTYSYDAWAFHARASLLVNDSSAIARLKVFLAGCKAYPALLYHISYYDVLGPLHVAALYNFPIALVDPNPEDSVNAPTQLDGATPLTLASWQGHQSIAQELLSLSNIFVNATDSEGVSALQAASHRGRAGIVRLLLAYPGIKVNLKDSKGGSALLAASIYGHEEIVSLLLQHPDIDANGTDDQGWTALMAASHHGHGGIAKLLLDHPRTDVNLTDMEEWSALMKAACAGHEGTVEHLLSHTEIDVNQVDFEGWSALMMASLHGHGRIASRLLVHPYTQVNSVDRQGWSALMVASQGGLSGILHHLLADPTIDVNLKDNQGRTALRLSIQCGHGSCVKLLLAHPGTNVNAADNDQRTPLMIASENGSEEMVRLLISHPSIEINLVDGKGLSALARAAICHNDSAVGLLLTLSNIEVNLTTSSGNALTFASQNGCEGVVRLLLAHPKINGNAAGHAAGRTPLIEAAIKGEERIVRLLLAHPGIDANMVDTFGWSALIAAAFYGYAGVVELLVAHPEIEINRANRQGLSAIMGAAAGGYERTVELLLALPNIDANLRLEGSGATCLTMASWNGHEGSVKLLLAHPDIDVNLEWHGHTALMFASKYGHTGIVRLLLAHPNIQVHRSTPHGSTAFLMASEYGHIGVVELLLAVPDLDVNSVDGDGDSAVKMAAENGHEEIVRMLLDSNPAIDLSVVGKHGQTAMSAALANGRANVVQLLQDFLEARSKGLTGASNVGVYAVVEGQTRPEPFLENRKQGGVGDEAGAEDRSEDEFESYEDALEFFAQ